jgi:hypothetical protein
MVAYHGSGTTYSGPTVGFLQNTTYTDTGGSGANGGGANAITIFDAFTVTGNSSQIAFAGDRLTSSLANVRVGPTMVKSPTLTPELTAKSISGSAFATVGLQPKADDAVAVLDRVLLGWGQNDTGLSRDAVSRSPSQGVDVAVGRTLVTQSTGSRPSVAATQALDLLLEQGGVQGSLFSASKQQPQKKPIGWWIG